MLVVLGKMCLYYTEYIAVFFFSVKTECMANDSVERGKNVF